MTYSSSTPQHGRKTPVTLIGEGLGIRFPTDDVNYNLLAEGIGSRLGAAGMRGVEIRKPGAKREAAIQIVGKKLLPNALLYVPDEDRPKFNIPTDVVITALEEQVPEILEGTSVSFNSLLTPYDRRMNGSFMIFKPTKADTEYLEDLENDIVRTIRESTGINLSPPWKPIDLTTGFIRGYVPIEAQEGVANHMREALPMTIDFGPADFMSNQHHN